eukprot:scaffold422_cov399-Prasinococcus_capsulatus_cf.AAC.10
MAPEAHARGAPGQRALLQPPAALVREVEPRLQCLTIRFIVDAVLKGVSFIVVRAGAYVTAEADLPSP